MIRPLAFSERSTRPSTMPAASRPEVDRLLHPGRHRHRADAAVLAVKVDEHPAAVALLNVLDRKRRGFGAAQPAADQQGQDGAIAPAFEGRGIGCVDELFGLRFGQPVPCPRPLLLGPGHLRDPGRRLPAPARPWAAASRASFRMAARRWLTVEGA